MTGRIAGLKIGKNFFIGLAVFVISGIVLDLYADRRGLSYRELIIASGLLIVGVIVFGKERGVRYGFILWVLTLALGYRTVELTPDLPLHPSEILLWLLLACLCVQSRMASNTHLTFPVWLWLFIPFWVLAWWPMIGGIVHWDQMLNEFRNFALLIPLMIIASVVLKHENYWRYLLLAFFFAGSAIAFIGILEYWFPEVIKVFPAFISSVKPSITEEGFARAQFSFWGGPQATFICVLALPAMIPLFKWSSLWSRRALIIAGSVMQIVAIYIGGYRSIWLVLLIQLLIGCVLGLKKRGAMTVLFCLILIVGGYELIALVPKTSERALSGIAALQGHPIDSSATSRQDRALGALTATIEAPFGNGWSSVGWVHSDFLQVAANLGIIGGLIFLAGYLYTLLRLVRRVLPNLKSGEHGELGFSLLLSFIAVGGILAMEGASVLPQLILPVWFVWVLTETWLRKSAEAFEPVISGTVINPFGNDLAPVRFSQGLKTYP